jgi:response regulator of citrate/malate metabolism
MSAYVYKNHKPLLQNRKIKVLLVDDAMLITKRLSEMIGEVEAVSDIFVSSNYENAVNIVEANKPDLVLLDIHLPDKSGIELLGYLRTNHPDLIVIMVTNKASQYYRDLCQQEGAHHFIDKSKEFEKIPDILRTYCK